MCTAVVPRAVAYQMRVAANATCVKAVMTMARLSERDRERLSVFVDEMRAMREERDWSRADLAAQARYPESLIAMVENCDRSVTQSLAKALDRAFGTPGFTVVAAGPGASAHVTARTLTRTDATDAHRAVVLAAGPGTSVT